MNAPFRSAILPLALLLLGAAPVSAGGPATPDLPPQPTVTVQPARPRPVFHAGTVDGVVEVVFTIEADGRVTNAAIRHSTHGLLENAALAAIRQWKFSPAVKNGEPVAVRALQSFVFPSPDEQRALADAKPAAKPAPKTQVASGK